MVDAVAAMLAVRAHRDGIVVLGSTKFLKRKAVWRWLPDEDRERHRAFARELIDAALAQRAARPGEVITQAYVDELLDAVARRTGYRMANDRFGLVPALLAEDRARRG